MQTVVGVFDTAEEAERAQKSLLNTGFDDSAVRVQSQAALPGDDTSPGKSAGNESSQGFMASISHFFSDIFGGENEEHAGTYSEAVRRGSSVVVVTVPDEQQVEAARAALAAAGAVDIDKRAEGWRQAGYSGFDPQAQPLGADEIQADRSQFPMPAGNTRVDDGTVLPVVREDIEIGKREVDLGAVRVFTRTETRPVSEQVQLREEHADIERRAVDRPATEADLKAFEGGSIEVREMAERPVVSKTARVVEEVVVGKKATTRTQTISDQLRNTVVDVENSAAGQDVPDYRSHYDSNFSALGGSYDDYEPAYRYGSMLRSDSRYANRSWDEAQADAQSDWTRQNPGGSWEGMKLAIKHGWESMTGKR